MTEQDRTPFSAGVRIEARTGALILGALGAVLLAVPALAGVHWVWHAAAVTVLTLTWWLLRTPQHSEGGARNPWRLLVGWTWWLLTGLGVIRYMYGNVALLDGPLHAVIEPWKRLFATGRLIDGREQDATTLADLMQAMGSMLAGVATIVWAVYLLAYGLLLTMRSAGAVSAATRALVRNARAGAGESQS